MLWWIILHFILTLELTTVVSIASVREQLSGIAEGSNEAQWKKYLTNEIDFFLGTLEVRKDAIKHYNDYNNEFKSIFYNPDLEGLSLNEVNTDLEDGEYKDEKTDRVKEQVKYLLLCTLLTLSSHSHIAVA